MLQRPSGVVALLTDFGLRDPYVGIVKGVVLRNFPRAVLVDVCHDVPPQDVATGALFLGAAAKHFPAGTVFVAVVDPGVGTARRALAAHDGESYFVVPDNGLLDAVLARAGGRAEVRSVELERLGLAPESATFHGRDVFAPVAAWLAGGRFGFQALGPRIADPVRLPGGANAGVAGGVGGGAGAAAPRVVHVDAYGNLVTNVPAAALAGHAAVEIGGRRAAVAHTYGAVPAGSLLALANSFGLVEIAVANGNAAASLGLGRGAPVRLVAGGPPPR